MSIIKRPMLAPHTSVDLDTFNSYPVYVSPKYDGIRCLIMDGKPVSRTLKPISNQFISSTLKMLSLPDGLDGEIVTYKDFDCLQMETYNEVQSKVMSVKGESYFLFNVFDWIRPELYVHRHGELGYWWGKQTIHHFNRVNIVPQQICSSKEHIENWEQHYLKLGFEGLMLKSTQGYYKQGRATLNEGIIWKLKRFEDSEALVVGMEEEMENSNPIEVNELGQNYRSKSLQNMTPKGTMGKLICRDIHHPEYEQFEIGTGFSRRDREEWWDQRLALDHAKEGQPIIKYKYQRFGMKNKPRQPVYLGLRNPVDM